MYRCLASFACSVHRSSCWSKRLSPPHRSQQEGLSHWQIGPNGRREKERFDRIRFNWKEYQPYGKLPGDFSFVDLVYNDELVCNAVKHWWFYRVLSRPNVLLLKIVHPFNFIGWFPALRLGQPRFLDDPWLLHRDQEAPDHFAQIVDRSNEAVRQREDQPQMDRHQLEIRTRSLPDECRKEGLHGQA